MVQSSGITLNMKKRQSVKTKMIEFRNPCHIKPPGALREILSHPINKSEAMELAIFPEHRYAFFYWNKWIQENINSNQKLKEKLMI